MGGVTVTHNLFLVFALGVIFSTTNGNQNDLVWHKRALAAMNATNQAFNLNHMDVIHEFNYQVHRLIPSFLFIIEINS